MNRLWKQQFVANVTPDKKVSCRLSLLFMELKQPNLVELCSLRKCINRVNFVRIVQSTRSLVGRNYIVKIFPFSGFRGPYEPTPPKPITVKFGREERTYIP